MLTGSIVKDQTKITKISGLLTKAPNYMEKFCHLPTQATLWKPTLQFDAFVTILDKLLIT